MSQPFTIYQGASKKTISDVDTTVSEAGESFVVDTSLVQVNNPPLDSLYLNVIFSNFLPDPVAALSKGWRIQATIEAKGEGTPEWFIPIGSMFDPLGDPSQGQREVIVVAPNIFNIDEGVPINIVDGTSVVTRISRQQGILGADFRVVISVSDSKAGTEFALTDFDVEIYGATYDHAG